MAKIENHKYTVDESFRECFYIVPDYQREYVWTDKEVHQLLDDINEQLDDDGSKEYFIGTVLVSPAGQKGHYDVIDGQQRLTTFFLLLCALRHRFLTVKDATERSELELDMIRERWSKSDLDDVLRLRYGKRKHAGRRPKRAKNSSDAILQILRAVEQAQRALVQYSSVEVENTDEPVKLSPKLHKAITATNTSLDSLREVAQQVVTRTRGTGGEGR